MMRRGGRGHAFLQGGCGLGNSRSWKFALLLRLPHSWTDGHSLALFGACAVPSASLAPSDWRWAGCGQPRRRSPTKPPERCLHSPARFFHFGKRLINYSTSQKCKKTRCKEKKPASSEGEKEAQRPGRGSLTGEAGSCVAH